MARPPSALEVGDRVFLRAPTAHDRDELLELARASRRLHRPWVAPPATPEAFTAWLRRTRDPRASACLVCLKDGGAIVGVINLSEIVRGAFHSAYTSYWAHAAHAGKGYMSEGLGLLLRHAFRTLRLHRLEANIQPGNERSIALVRRAGFRLEGLSPRYLKIGGRWRDHERWAITVEDWRSRARLR
jgi:[ribosomal protein S5]-alanine N-acetyltransferase